MKRFTNFVMHNPTFARFVDLLEKFDDRRPNLLRVLTYHRVGEPHSSPYLYPSIAVSSADFAQQMRFLRARYTPISITEVLRSCQNGHALPPGAVLVTFDDAYCDFEEHAWPEMKRYEIPCALFVATAYPDHPENIFWWDRLYAAFRYTQRKDYLTTTIGKFPLAEPDQRLRAFSRLQDHIKSLPHSDAMAQVDEIVKELDVTGFDHSVLSWNALRRLAQEGVELGAHSQTHPLLNQILIEKVRAEVAGSMRDLKREIGSVLPVFAYPGGNLNEQVVNVLREEGVILGFTIQRGINDFNLVNRLLLRRINVGMRTSLAGLRAQFVVWSRICTH